MSKLGLCCHTFCCCYWMGRWQLAFDGLIFLSVNLVRVTTLSCRLDRTFQVAKKSAVNGFVFREVQNASNGWLRWANHAITREQNFASKNLSSQSQANVVFYLYCSYQCLVISEQRRMPVTDGMTHTRAHTHTHKRTDYHMPPGPHPPRHNYPSQCIYYRSCVT